MGLSFFENVLKKPKLETTKFTLKISGYSVRSYGSISKKDLPKGILSPEAGVALAVVEHLTNVFPFL